MKNLLSFLMIFLTISTSSAQNSVPLKLGDAAPFTGILFSKEGAEQVRYELLEKESLVKLNDSLNKSLEIYKKNEDLYTQRYNNLLDQNNNLSLSLEKARDSNTLRDVILVVSGMLAVGLAGYAYSRIVK